MSRLTRALRMFTRKPPLPANVGAPAASGDELRLYRQVLAQSGDAVMITVASGVIEYVNAAFERLTGYRADEIVGRRPSMFKSGEHDEVFYARLRGVLKQGGSFRAVFINRNKSGSLYHEEKTISPIRDRSGHTTHFVSVGRNVNARIATERRLYYLAYYDVLTGLPNRKLFQKQLDEVLEREAQEHGVVVLLRIDNLHRINDSLGRGTGDEVMRVLASRLQSLCHDGCSLARGGGAEFIVLVRNQAACGREILDVLDEPMGIGQRKVSLTGSVGIARYPQHAQTAEKLIVHAELDLQCSGAGGRSGFLRHDESLRVDADFAGGLEITAELVGG